MGSGITIDTREFKAALKEYREYTKRDLATIINTKGFYIARGAVRLTHRPTKEEIRRKLQEFIGGGHLTKTKVTRYTATGMSYQAPLLALIINKKRGQAGKPGLYGDRMKKAMNSEMGRRYASIAFIAAGFLPAVKAFEPYAERKGAAPARDSEAKQLGRPKGSGTAARSSGSDGWRVRGVIVNSASARGDKKGALEKFGGAALRQAIANEVASMESYIAQKLQASADKVNAKRK
jgi:hypothetical protein